MTYVEGEHYIFNEDGQYCEVILLKDLSDETWEKYQLEVMKFLHNWGGSLNETFEVSHRKKGGYAGYGNWYIREVGTTPYG